MKTASAQHRLSPGITTLPFVIPTGAKRSGGTCGSADHLAGRPYGPKEQSTNYQQDIRGAEWNGCGSFV
jgi:hypothetical protein